MKIESISQYLLFVVPPGEHISTFLSAVWGLSLGFLHQFLPLSGNVAVCHQLEWTWMETTLSVSGKVPSFARLDLPCQPFKPNIVGAKQWSLWSSYWLMRDEKRVSMMKEISNWRGKKEQYFRNYFYCGRFIIPMINVWWQWKKLLQGAEWPSCWKEGCGGQGGIKGLKLIRL